MGKLVDKYLKQLYDDLEQQGMDILWQAAIRNDTIIRTGNMYDAYGLGIYRDGVLVRKKYLSPSPSSTEAHSGWRKHNIPSDTGRGYLDKFLYSYKPSGKGVAMVCVNAIFYTTILEDGAQGRPSTPISTKYHIISTIGQAFRALTNRYKGSQVRFITNRGR